MCCGITVAGLNAVASGHLPPHALTVFVPLIDVNPELGSPQFFVGSHYAAMSTALQQGATVDPPVSYELPVSPVGQNCNLATAQGFFF